MRSQRGLLASLLIALSLPAAIAVALATGGGGEPIIHFGVGIGFLLLATAAWDYSPSRALGWFGAVVAASFGGIFVLQGVSDAVGNPTLHQIAYDVFGQQIERTLPDVFLVWCVLVLATASEGRSRVIGWVTIGGVIALEVAVRLGPIVGMNITDPRFHILLPAIWLIFESAKHVGTTSRNEANDSTGNPVVAAAR